jgi:hypothetical protein
MKRVKQVVKPRPSLSRRFIYATSASVVFIVFAIVFVYLNTGVYYNVKAVASSQFSSAEATYSEISGTTLGTSSNDNQVFNDLNIGFTFNYDGANYTKVSVASNGFIAMGGSVASSASPISGGVTNNVISALGTDLEGRAGATLSYLVSGTAPYRQFVVQWKKYGRKNSSSDNFNFQIRLHETSNVIQIVYGDFDIDLFAPADVEVGLRGASNSSYKNRTTSSDWSNSSAGNSNTATCLLSKTWWIFFTVTILPDDGLTYTFLPASLGNTWLGYTTAWNSSSNWSSSIPNPTIDGNIPTSPIGGEFPIVSSNGNVKNLTIWPGAMITVNSGKKLTVKGDFINEGTSTTGAGELVIDNNVLQWIKGKIGNVDLNKISNNVSLNNDIEILGTLKLTKGSLNLNGKTLTISGQVITTNGTISGSNTSDLIINGSGNLGTLQFAAGAQTLRNLTVNRAGNGAFTLGSDIAISNQLALTNGTIETGTNKIIITSPSTSAISGHGSSSYIIGNLRRYINSTGSYDLPVGSSTKGYQFANINFNSSSGISYIDAKFTNGVTAQPDLMIGDVQVGELLNNGYWTITPDVESTANYDLTIIAKGHTNGGLETSQHTLLKRHNASSAWEALGVHNNSWNSGSGANPIRLTRKGLTSFSDVGGGVSTGSPLPVVFTDFKGTFEGDNVILKWATTSEKNNNHFVVERSKDAIQYDSIGHVEGNGNSSTWKDYTFKDSDVLEDQYYYRIKQVDANTLFSFSNIISVARKIIQTEEPLTVDIYPNPTTFDNINLKIKTRDKQEIVILLMGTDGKILSEEKFKTDELDELIKLKINTPLNPKTYLLKVQQQNNSIIKHVILTQ